MKKRFLAIGLATGAMVFMTACGDETTNTDIIKADIAANADSLPECNKSYDGMLASIPSKGTILVCTQGNWENVAKTIQTSTDSSGNSTNQSGCTAKTTDGGVQIVCDGKAVATLKNGEKGAEGSDGKQGPQGDKGDPGSNGSGSSGKDLKLDETDCSVTYIGFGITLYKCGGEEYIENQSGYTANLKTWNALNLETAIKNKAGTNISTLFAVSSFESAAGNSDGKFLWNGEDAWIDDDAAVTTERLGKDFAIRAQAKLTVESGATTLSMFPIEPMVGVYMQFSSISVHSLGGLCLTYEAKQKMELIAVHNIGLEVARVPLNASSKVTTVNILPGDFKADSADAKVAGILGDAHAIIIKAVGSLEAGEYENEFAIYEIGAYGQCNGPTIKDFEEKAKTIQKGTIRDSRDGKTYKTVTIGDQTWFAENLDYDYKVHVNPLHDGEDPDFECDDSHECVEKLVYNYSDENKALYGGRLYTWAAAIDSASLARAATPMTCGTGFTCSLPATVQGICPQGWHVPSVDDYNTLRATAMDFVGYNSEVLRALALLDESAGGTNWLGFSAKLGGIVQNNGTTLYNENVGLYVILKDEFTDSYYYIGTFGKTAMSVPDASHSKNYFRAIRCIQDQAKE